MKLSPAAKKAISIGTVCSTSYLAVYVARNTLGAVSPQMIEAGSYTTESIGALSSLFFISYAVGQLINGSIGDRIKAKYMISLGLCMAGLCVLAFPWLSGIPFASNLVYGMTGFFLSMIYGPMTKVVAENTEPIYATRCSLGYTFASFFGSPAAGVLAAFLSWVAVFTASGTLLLIMSLASFLIFTLFEKRGMIRYGQYQRPPKSTGSLRILIQHRIIRFTLISMITGVVRTTVVFWLPTYISQHLGFPADQLAMIFTAATFVISMTAFVAIFLYERLGRNMDLVIRLAFSSAAVCFLLVWLIKLPALNLIFMVLAILTCNCASSMLWSRYCPSLRDTGMVSSATGFLDFVSYMSASISSTLFANAVSGIGWGNLILVWCGLMVFGIAVMIPFRKKIAA